MDELTKTRLGSMDRTRVTNNRRVRGKLLFASVTATLGTIGFFSLTQLHAPNLSQDDIVIAIVMRGNFVRTIDASGRLVPEETRLIAAHARARVDKRHVEPGTIVSDGAALLELSDPEMQRKLLETRSELAAAEAELITTRAVLDRQLLEQDSAIQSTHYMHLDAARQADAYENLARGGAVSSLELSHVRDRVSELANRVQIENGKKGFLLESRLAQLSSQQAKIDQLKNLLAFQLEQVHLLHVSAPIAGVIQDILVEEGQWVHPGEVMAIVITPDRLMAELRVPQTEGDQVTIGQEALIDTRLGTVTARVSRVEPSVQEGAVIVEVELTESIPKGARAQLTIKGTLKVAELDDATYLRRPAGTIPNSRGSLFRITDSGRNANRVDVSFGIANADHIQILNGAREGDRFIISDMSGWSERSEVQISR